MFHVNSARVLIYRRLFKVGVIALSLAIFSGCMSDKERILQVVEQERARCQKAEGTFYETTFFDGTKKELLAQACDVAAENVVIESKIDAKIQMGPYTWHAGQSGAWVLSGATWDALDRAHRALAGDDVSVDLLEDAERYFAQAQQEFPQSAYIRTERLKNLLTLREKSRSASTKEPHTIGEQAQQHYDELVDWAKEQEDFDTIGQAKILVIRHLQQYLRRQKSALDAIGSQDEWLEKSMQLAIREGNKKEADEIREELENRQASADDNRKAVQVRIEAIQTALCKEASTLSGTGIKSADLRNEIQSLSQTIQCDA